MTDVSAVRRTWYDSVEEPCGMTMGHLTSRSESMPIRSRSVKHKESGASTRSEPTHEGRVQPDVCLGKLVSGDEFFSSLEHLFEAIERLKERDHIVLVRLLSRRESRFVNALFERTNTRVSGWENATESLTDENYVVHLKARKNSQIVERG